MCVVHEIVETKKKRSRQQETFRYSNPVLSIIVYNIAMTEKAFTKVL